MLKLKIFVLTLTALGCSTMSPEKNEKICKFPSEPVVMLEKENSILQYWDYDEGYFEGKANFQDLTFLRAYQQKVQKEVRDLSQKALWSKSYDLEKAGDQQNMRIAKTLWPKVRKINCLEALLLNLQGSRVDLISTPTEFLAFKLKKNKRVRLLYFTSNINGVRGLGFLHSKIQKFVDDNWILEKNIHNHTLNLNDKNYRGTIGPSVSDAFVFKMELKDFNLKAAVITNGFESMEVPSHMFKGLSTEY